MIRDDRLLVASVSGLFVTLPLASTLTIDLGFPLTIAHGFAAIVAVRLLWLDRFRPRISVWLPALLFVGFCLASLASFAVNLGGEVPQYAWATGRNSPEVRSATKVLWLIGNVAIALVIANAVQRTSTERLAIRSLAVGAVVASLYAIYQEVGQTHGFYVPLLPGTEFVPGSPSFWLVPRAKSTFLEPSFFGAYLAAALPFVVVAWSHLASPIKRGLTMVPATTVVVGGILVTFSVAGWLSAAVASALLVVLLALIGGRNIILAFAGSTVLALVLTVAAVPGVIGAIGALVDKGTVASGAILPTTGSDPSKLDLSQIAPGAPERSAAERVATTRAAISMFRSSPVFGVGPGNFGFRYSEFRPAGTAEPGQLLIANDVYAELLAESGLIGFMTFTVGFLALGVLLVRAYRRGQGSQRVPTAAALAATVGMTVAFLTAPSFTILYQWAIVGLACALIARSHDRSASEW